MKRFSILCLFIWIVTINHNGLAQTQTIGFQSLIPASIGSYNGPNATGESSGKFLTATQLNNKRSLFTCFDSNLNLLWAKESTDTILIESIDGDASGNFWYGGYKTINNGYYPIFGKINSSGTVLFSYEGDSSASVKLVSQLSSGNCFIAMDNSEIFLVNNSGSIIASEYIFDLFSSPTSGITYSVNNQDEILFSYSAFIASTNGIIIGKKNANLNTLFKNFYTNNIYLRPTANLLKSNGEIVLSCSSNISFYQFTFLKIDSNGNLTNSYTYESINPASNTPRVFKLFELTGNRILIRDASLRGFIITDSNLNIASENYSPENNGDPGDMYAPDTIVFAVTGYSVDMGQWVDLIYKTSVDQFYPCNSITANYQTSPASISILPTAINNSTSSYNNFSSTPLNLTINNVGTYSVCVTGEEEIIDKNESLLIFPNPAQDNFGIKCEEGIHTVEVYTIQGQKMLSKVLNQYTDQVFLDTHDLESGLYTVLVKSAHDNYLSKKLIIIK